MYMYLLADGEDEENDILDDIAGTVEFLYENIPIIVKDLQWKKNMHINDFKRFPNFSTETLNNIVLTFVGKSGTGTY